MIGEVVRASLSSFLEGFALISSHFSFSIPRTLFYHRNVLEVSIPHHHQLTPVSSHSRAVQVPSSLPRGTGSDRCHEPMDAADEASRLPEGAG